MHSNNSVKFFSFLKKEKKLRNYYFTYFIGHLKCDVITLKLYRKMRIMH